MHLHSDTLVFLSELAANNNRTWFNDNKPRYQAISEALVDFTAALLQQLAQLDEKMLDINPKNCVFRIYRDARFSKDKSPYKTHIGLHLVTSDNKADWARAGYYLHIEPGASLLAGGAHAPTPEWLKRIRTHLTEHGDSFTKLTQDSTFQASFGQVQGEKLLRNPQGYAPDHPQIEWLKYKTLTVMHPVPDAVVLSNELMEVAIKVFKAYLPFRDFLNRP